MESRKNRNYIKCISLGWNGGDAIKSTKSYNTNATFLKVSACLNCEYTLLRKSTVFSKCDDWATVLQTRPSLRTFVHVRTWLAAAVDSINERLSWSVYSKCGVSCILRLSLCITYYVVPNSNAHRLFSDAQFFECPHSNFI